MKNQSIIGDDWWHDLRPYKVFVDKHRKILNFPNEVLKSNYWLQINEIRDKNIEIK